MACDMEFVNPFHRFGTTTRSMGGVIRDTSRMAIDIVPLILLPTMDPERFERCSFSLQDAVSLLTITMTELPPFIIHFHKLRWHRVTPNAQCTPVLTQGCQMAVAEVINSPALTHYIAQRECAAAADAGAASLPHLSRRRRLPRGVREVGVRERAGKMSRAFAKLANGVRQRLKSISG